MKKRVFGTVLMLALIVSLFAVLSISASASLAKSGDFGLYSSMHWEIDDNHHLTISGNGSIPDYGNWNKTPWAYDGDGNRSYNTVTSITIGDGIKEIGNYAFAYFYYVDSISIGNSVERIGDCAFYKATSEKSNVDLVLPASVRKIGAEAFRECYGLKNIFIMSNNFETTGENNASFYYCYNVENLAIGTPDIAPGDKVVIGTECFEDCSGLKNVFLSKTVKEIKWDGFEDCDSLQNFYYGGTTKDYSSITIDMGSDDGNDCLTKLNRTYCDARYSFIQDDPDNYKYEYYVFGVSDWVFSDSPFFDLQKKIAFTEWKYDSNNCWRELPGGVKGFVTKFNKWDYDKTEYWRALPDGTKVYKAKFDKWDYDDTNYWHALPDGTKAHEAKFGQWERDEKTHWHILPDNTLTRKTSHIYQGKKCAVCEIAERSYSFYDEQGSMTELTESHQSLTTSITTLDSGWYLVNDQLDFGSTRLEINGDVKLLLANDCGITTSGGIHIGGSNKLTVYSETLDYSETNSMGYIKVTGVLRELGGIGSNNSDSGGTVIFCGGKISSVGSDLGSAIGSGYRSQSFTLTVYGGYFKNVEGKGSDAVGIGSGKGSSSTVTINGGVFENIRGYTGAAGIGCSVAGANCTLTINGGTFDGIYGGLYAAGIGNGSRSGSSVYCTLTINGGTFRNIQGGGNGGAGIGGGSGSDSNTVTINSGSFYNIRGGSEGPGIGSGSYYSSCDLTINGGDFDTIQGGDNAAGIGTGSRSFCNLTVNDGTFKEISSVGAGAKGTITIIKDLVGISGSVKTGFTLSGGSWWIILVGAVVILGGIAVVVVVTKKRKKAAK